MRAALRRFQTQGAVSVPVQTGKVAWLDVTTPDDSSLPAAERRQPGRFAFIVAMVLFACSFALGPVVAITGDTMLLQVMAVGALAGVGCALWGAAISYIRGAGGRG